MKIVHISDIHIRNFRYHDEYRRCFDDLAAQIRRINPDMIVNTGDTAHSKVHISPEFVKVASDHFRSLANIAPYYIVLGNHDLNLRNKDRLDAISPIISGLYGSTAHPLVLFKDSGLVLKEQGFNFWNYGIADSGRFPLPAEVSGAEGINIGLFHGSVGGCVVDSGFALESAEHEIKIFDGLDFLMMGDIHKRQSFKKGRYWYPGSLIQQNFGEDPEKGFLLWDIKSKDEFDVKFHPVKGSRGFYTLGLDANKNLVGDVPPEGARVRAVVDSNLTLSEQKSLELTLRERFKPFDVVSITSLDRNMRAENGSFLAKNKEFKRQSDEELLRSFLAEKGCSEDTAQQIMELDQKFRLATSGGRENRSGVFWKLDKLHWSNMFNYGEANTMDLSKLNGLVGIFAPNTAGKSSIFEVLLQTLFDKISKDVPRNVDLINDNKDAALMVAEISLSGKNYVVERTIERIKHSQKKYSEAREWGKTVLQLTCEGAPLNGDSRPETERTIRDMIGTFDDFVMTTMVSQNPVASVAGGADIINCKETDRKKILFRFLELDSFEKRYALARDESRSITAELKDVDPVALNEQLEELRAEEGQADCQLEELTARKNDLQSQHNELNIKLSAINSLKVQEYVNPKALSRQITASQIEMHQLKNFSSISFSNSVIAAIDLRELVAAEPAAVGHISLPALQKELQKNSKSITAAEVSESKGQFSLDRARGSLSVVESVPCSGSFPSCKFITDAVIASKEIPSLQDAVTAIISKRSGLEKEKVELDQMVLTYTKHSDWQTKVAELTARVKKFESEHETYDLKYLSCLQSIEKMQLELTAVEQQNNEREQAQQHKMQVKSLEDSISIYSQTIENIDRSRLDASARRGQIIASISSLEKKLAEVERVQKQAAVYELYLDAIGKYGLPHVILTSMLPVINDEINKILSNVVDFSVFLEHDPIEHTIGLYLQYGEYKSRFLGLASGAEKFIASLAIRVALLNVSLLPKTNFLIVDEGFGKLDPERLESLQKMFHYLKDVFETIFVVSHVDVLKDMVDHNIEIATDTNGYAQVNLS